MERATLDELAIANGTDKATVFTRTYAKPKGYSVHYDKFFSPLRDEPIKFLEIGVGGGESIRTWLEYFTFARVFGVDNVGQTNPWNNPHDTPNSRYKFYYGNQTDETFWTGLSADHVEPWNIVIDDGGHSSNEIITSFLGLWDHVASGGLYCIEDLGVAYGSLFVPAGWPNHMDWLRTHLDAIHQRVSDIDSIYFASELAILRKK